MAELSNVPVSELLEEALQRPNEMIDERGFLSNKAFDVADRIATRVCVDGVAVRQNEQGETELMAIRRNTGPYAGKLCLVGGGIAQVRQGNQLVPESVEEALRRHFKTDLGFEIEPVKSWDQPQYLAQDMRPIDGEVREGFTPNPASRHLIAARFLVRITNYDDAPVFGENVGGQEASGVEWFTKSAMPDLDEFGYNHGVTYNALFPIADQIT